MEEFLKSYLKIQALPTKEKPLLPARGRPPNTDARPPPAVKSAALTYEAYYTKLTQESELHKFKVHHDSSIKINKS